MKERPILFSAPMVRAILAGSKTQTRRILKSQSSATRAMLGIVNCHLGQPDDRLWVREAFSHHWHHSQPPYFYRATDDDTVGLHPDFEGWKPSIHMPRAASRIDLLIKSVRVERLQAISETDAESEGIDFFRAALNANKTLTKRQSFEELWEFIHGAGSWHANPWVWAIEFERIKP